CSADGWRFNSDGRVSRTMKRMAPRKRVRAKVAFLFDVDNTLLDNDGVTADLQEHLKSEVGPRRANRYWAIFETMRAELGYADYLGLHGLKDDPVTARAVGA